MDQNKSTHLLFSLSPFPFLAAFSYHMQYAHGISPTTTLPFSPPVAFRATTRVPNHKNEKTELLEGQCHRCGEWTAVEGVKCVEAKVRFKELEFGF